jgi:hypothetical protein
VRGLHYPEAALRAAFSPDDHWLFEFMQVPSTVRYYHDKAYRDELHRQVNAITREYVGKTFFEENTWQHSPKRIENLFHCEFAYHEGRHALVRARDFRPRAFAKILDAAAATDLQSWAFPPAFLDEWETRQASGESMPLLGTGSRGPATIMTSVLDVETVFYWLYDHPELMARFGDLLAEKMVELNSLLRQFSGNRPARLVDHRRQQRPVQPQALRPLLRTGAGAGAGSHGARRRPALPAF